MLHQSHEALRPAFLLRGEHRRRPGAQTKDPTTGWGIADAFRDAALLARALDDTLSGRAAADDALGAYQSQRDAAAMPVYELTLMMASGEMPAFAAPAAAEA